MCIRDRSIVNSAAKFGSKYDTTKDKLQTIEFDGKTYELVKVKDGDSEAGTINGPLTQVTYIYKPKEDPKPVDPETPGEDPKDPGKDLGKEDPKDPGKDPGKEDPCLLYTSPSPRDV